MAQGITHAELMERHAEIAAQLDEVNLELVSRGRCTCCGLHHNVMECHRLSGIAQEDYDDTI